MTRAVSLYFRKTPLFKRGVTLIGGIKVMDSERLIQIIIFKEAAPNFKAACKYMMIEPKQYLSY